MVLSRWNRRGINVSESRSSKEAAELPPAYLLRFQASPPVQPSDIREHVLVLQL